MALALTPRLFRRGLELFAVISLIGVVVVLVVFGENLQAFLSALAHLHWRWLLVGLGLASMDWIGGGSRLGGGARAVHPGGGWGGMGVAGGMSGGGGYLTPVQTGAGAPLMWAVRPARARPPPTMRPPL